MSNCTLHLDEYTIYECPRCLLIERDRLRAEQGPRLGLISLDTAARIFQLEREIERLRRDHLDESV